MVRGAGWISARTLLQSWTRRMLESHLDEIISELKAVRGIDLSGYRRSTLRRRLAIRLARVCDGDPQAYIRLLRTDRSEADQLIAAVAIKVSSFFRNPLVFELTSENILPEIIERKRRSGSREIRIWSAGCATGEEAYSIAILLHQALKGKLTDWTVHIFATDMDDGALQAAKSGVYSRDRLENVKLGVLDKYFFARDDHYEVRPFLRKMVRFSLDDLTSQELAAPAESIFGGFDLVFCRNVLIYFSIPVQTRVINRLSQCLMQGGYLILGDSESIPAEMESKLQTIDRKNRIFHKTL